MIHEHILPIAYGSGSNGKSTILNAVLDVLGQDYSMKAPPDLLMTTTGQAHPTERAKLFRKRLVVAMETAEGRRLNEVMVKELTGGDRIMARRMREDFWEFAPSHKIVMGTNHMPEIRGTDHGIWRRIRKLPFEIKIEDKDADVEMSEKLRAEHAGILAWLVRGCSMWQSKGLVEPESVTQATSQFRVDQDVIAMFLKEMIVTSQGSTVRCGELYKKFAEWAEAANLDKLNMTRFGRSMKERGYRTTEGTRKSYLDIALQLWPADKLGGTTTQGLGQSRN